MNKSFPFLLFAVTIGCFLTLAYYSFAYAQQHDSPASAQELDTGHTHSLLLPAYATEYFYFSLPDTGNKMPAITLSNSSKVRIELCDSRETTLNYSISSSHVITISDSLTAGERYFLKLDNQSSQDKKITILLRYIEKTGNMKKSEKTKKPIKTVKPRKTAKPKKNPKPKKTQKPKKAQRPKNTQKPIKTVKPKKTLKSVTTPKLQKSTKSKVSPKPILTPKPLKTSKPTVALKPHKNTKPKTTLKPQKIINPNLKSNFVLPTHFIRIRSGTSFAIAEALNLSEPSDSLSYQCIFSDNVSIQNGILYAKTKGIAIIEITGNDCKSSCTICIQ